MPDGTHGYLEGARGVRVFYRAWERSGSRGSVLCVHGLGEHAGRYARLAEALHEIDVDLYAMDLRGHGRSQGRRGHVSSMAAVLADLDRLRRRACGDVARRPTFVFGHSLGGLVAGRYVEAFPLDGLRGVVFFAPFVEERVAVPNWKRTVAAVADRLAPALTLHNGLALEDLFRREEDRRAFDTDPLVHRRISARLWGEMTRASERLRGEADRVRVPALFQLAGEDRIVSNEASRRLAASIGPLAEVIEYEGAHHALLHDPRAGEALGDLVAWLEANLGGTHEGIQGGHVDSETT